MAAGDNGEVGELDLKTLGTVELRFRRVKNAYTRQSISPANNLVNDNSNSLREQDESKSVNEKAFKGMAVSMHSK